MSENEQKSEPNSPAESNDRPVAKIDFGTDKVEAGENTGQVARRGAEQGPGQDSGQDAGQGPGQNREQGKEASQEKNSGAGEKAQSENGGAPAKGAQSASEGDARKNAEPKKDDDIKKFIADTEARFERQLDVNRKLAALVEEQLDLLLSVRQSMLAMRKTLESSAASKKKLETALETVKDGAEGLPDAHWINRARGTLAVLQRNGMV